MFVCLYELGAASDIPVIKLKLFLICVLIIKQFIYSFNVAFTAKGIL